MEVAGILREQRERAGLTQAGLAARCGTSQATISAYEQGHKHPSVATLERLLAGCGARLSVEQGREPVVVPSAREQARASRALADVLALAAALPTRHAADLGYPRLPLSRAA